MRTKTPKRGWIVTAHAENRSYNIRSLIMCFRRAILTDAAVQVADAIRCGETADAEYCRGKAEKLRAETGSTLYWRSEISSRFEVRFQANTDGGCQWYGIRLGEAELRSETIRAIATISKVVTLAHGDPTPEAIIDALGAVPVTYGDCAEYVAADDLPALQLPREPQEQKTA